MKRTVVISEEDAWRIYELIEELHSFLHQPENTSDPEEVRKWLQQKGVYADLREVYYDLVANWFPVDTNTGDVVPPPGTRRRFG